MKLFHSCSKDEKILVSIGQQMLVERQLNFCCQDILCNLCHSDTHTHQSVNIYAICSLLSGFRYCRPEETQA